MVLQHQPPFASGVQGRKDCWRPIGTEPAADAMIPSLLLLLVRSLVMPTTDNCLVSRSNATAPISDCQQSSQSRNVGCDQGKDRDGGSDLWVWLINPPTPKACIIVCRGNRDVHVGDAARCLTMTLLLRRDHHLTRLRIPISCYQLKARDTCNTLPTSCCLTLSLIACWSPPSRLSARTKKSRNAVDRLRAYACPLHLGGPGQAACHEISPVFLLDPKRRALAPRPRS